MEDSSALSDAEAELERAKPRPSGSHLRPREPHTFRSQEEADAYTALLNTPPPSDRGRQGGSGERDGRPGLGRGSRAVPQAAARRSDRSRLRWKRSDIDDAARLAVHFDPAMAALAAETKRLVDAGRRCGPGFRHGGGHLSDAARPRLLRLHQADRLPGRPTGLGVCASLARGPGGAPPRPRRAPPDASGRVMSLGPVPGRDGARGAAPRHGRRAAAPRLHLHGLGRVLLAPVDGDGSRRGLGSHGRGRAVERLRGAGARATTGAAVAVQGRGGHGSARARRHEFRAAGKSARKARRAVPEHPQRARSPSAANPPPSLPARSSGGAPSSPPAAAGADLARGAAMIAPNLPRPSTAPAQPARPYPDPHRLARRRRGVGGAAHGAGVANRDG